MRVPVVNSTAADYPTWLSEDECRLYLVSSRGASPQQLYVATRSPGD
jgi:hypothetical protein